jgi:putative FmdB family regulatory protein
VPIYPHKCERCGRVEDRLYASFEQLCREPAVRCLQCGSRMERLVSAPAFSISGYSYKNGYSEEKS